MVRGHVADMTPAGVRGASPHGAPSTSRRRFQHAPDLCIWCPEPTSLFFLPPSQQSPRSLPRCLGRAAQGAQLSPWFASESAPNDTPKVAEDLSGDAWSSALQIAEKTPEMPRPVPGEALTSSPQSASESARSAIRKPLPTHSQGRS
jgi:hypothetical protein